jgi:hypothetical protein
MELSWITRVRVTAVLLLGAIGLGIAAWPIVAPADPVAVVSASYLHPAGGLALVGLCAAAGFVAYFAAWPFGRHIGLLAVPAGLAVWALRSQDMFKPMQMAGNVPERLAVFAHLRWDSLFWLCLVGAGTAGVWLASRLWPAPNYRDPLVAAKPKAGYGLDMALAPIVGLAVAHFVTAAMAQGSGIIGDSLPTQPATTQAAFAIMVAFGVAAFLIGRFLRAGLFWAIVASALLPIVDGLLYARPSLLDPISRAYPATCFPTPALAILPIQMVAFGTLGATVGYWVAVRVEYWRAHLSA